jgi:hypothetical protein
LEYRKELEERALLTLPQQPDFATSLELQVQLAHALWGRVAYGEQPDDMLARFATLPLYPEEVELQRQHALALCAVAQRQADPERARSISNLPKYSQDETLREIHARALAACSEALTARAREQFLLLAQAETVAEEIPQIADFATHATMQMHYGDALYALMWGWRRAVPTTQQNHRKAQSLVRKARALPGMDTEEALLSRWLPEIVRVEPHFASRLPELSGFASSGTLQNHYAAFLSMEASRAWTAADALARAEEIPALPLFAQWPTMAQAYVLALGHVLARGGPDDLELMLKVTRQLESGLSPNPAPALRGWDALLALQPDRDDFRRGRREWLNRFGFPEEASLAEVVRSRWAAV